MIDSKHIKKSRKRSASTDLLHGSVTVSLSCLANSSMHSGRKRSGFQLSAQPNQAKDRSR